MQATSTPRLRHAWVDDANAPLYVLRVPDAPSVEDVVEFCATTERFLVASPDRIGWVTDLEQLRSVGAVQRRLFVEANQRSRTQLEARVAAMGVSAPRAFQRGLITVFHWFVPTTFPFEVFADLSQATAWVAKHMP
jgi:hypothetical protein